MKPIEFHSCFQKLELKPAEPNCFTVVWCHIPLKISPCSLPAGVVLHDDVSFLKYTTSLEIWPGALCNLHSVMRSIKNTTEEMKHDMTRALELAGLYTAINKPTRHLVDSLAQTVLVTQLPAPPRRISWPSERKMPVVLIGCRASDMAQTEWSGVRILTLQRKSRPEPRSHQMIEWW